MAEQKSILFDSQPQGISTDDLRRIQNKMQGIKTYEIKVSCSIPVIEIYHVEAHDAREAEELYYDGKSRFIEDDTGDVEDHEVFSVEETEEG